MTSRSNDFGPLLADARRLAAQIPGTGIPSIQRNVQQLQHTASSSPPPSQSIAPQAQLFLAKTGVDLQREQQFLQSLQRRAQPSTQQSQQLALTSPPSQTQSHIDIEAYLNRSHSALLESVIREVSESSAILFDQYVEQRTVGQWDREKRDILDSLGFKAVNGKRLRDNDSDGISVGVGRNDRVTIRNQSAQSTMLASSSLPVEQSQYGRVVMELNDSRQHHRPYHLIGSLAAVSESLTSRRDREQTEIFALLSYLIDERDSQSLIGENHYSHAYQNHSRQLRVDLVNNAVQYCQQLFVKHLKSLSLNQSSMIGLVQGYVSVNVSAFTRLNDKIKDYHQSLPLWPQLYYLIRCGLYQNACQLLDEYAKSGGNDRDRESLSVLVRALQSRSNSQSLDQSVNDTLYHDYVYQFRTVSLSSSTIDPYKLAVYQLVGRYSVHATSIDIYSLVCDSAESYLWYKLTLVLGEESGESAHNADAQPQSQSLAALQQSLISHGEAHFNPNNQSPLTFVKVLLLAQCFEYALYYLCTKTHYLTLSLHCGLALHYYGLLTMHSDGNSDVLVSDRDGYHSLALAKVLRQYTESNGLVHSEPMVACHYALSLGSTRLTDSVALVKDIIVQSVHNQSFVSALLDSNTGLLAQWLDASQLTELVRQCASELTQRGSFTNAIQLLMTGHQYSAAAELLLSSLGGIVTGTSSDKRQSMLDLTQSLVRSSTNSHANGHSQQSLTRSQQSALSVMIALAQFFDYYRSGAKDYPEALNLIGALNLFPQRPDAIAAFSDWRSLPPSVTRILPDLCLALMQIYYQQFLALKDGVTSLGGGAVGSERESMKREWKERAKALVGFAGLQTSVIGADVNARLMRLESLMT